ncbi:MAG: hypothetical protein R3323_09780 [Wenzhouxiangellaceae bacterium]|nr:hypothetical protein [Wenzhouxiangellaceae bacterium]
MSERSEKPNEEASSEVEAGPEEGARRADAAAGSAEDDRASPGSSTESRSARDGGRRSGLVAWLALLVALAALAFATRAWWMPRFGWDLPSTPSAEVVALRDELDAIAARMDELTTTVEDLETRDDGLAERLSSIEAAREATPSPGDLAGSVGALRDEVGDLSSALAAVRDREPAGPDPALVERLDRLENRIGDLASDADRTADRIAARIGDSLDGRIENAEQQARTNRDRLESQQQSLADLQRSMRDLEQDLAGAVDGVGRRLAMTRVEALLSSARQRLHAFGDVEAATSAWTLALDDIAALDGLDAIERALERELRSLRALDPVAPAEVVRDLQAVAAEIDDWQVPGMSRETTAAQPGEGPTGWRARIGAALDGLVDVERVEKAGPSRAEVEGARRDLGAALDAASLAVARGDRELAVLIVERVRERTARIFGSSAPEVREALAMLESVPGRLRAPDPPPLDDALSRLRERLDRPE